MLRARVLLPALLLLSSALVPGARGQVPFEPLLEIPLAHGAHDVAIADLDEDGSPDILTTPELNVVLGNSVTYDVLPGNGDGTFAAPVWGQTIATHIIGRGEVADVDGDGHLDWVVPNGEVLGQTYFFAGNGSIPLQPPTSAGSSGATSGAVSRVVDLLGGDSHLDVVTLAIKGPFEFPASFQALVADGLGGYTQVNGPTVGQGTHSLAVGDLDGDGWMDVVTTNSTMGLSISVFPATSATTWGPAVTVGTGGLAPYDVEVVDVDGDGALDLLVGSGSGGILFYPGVGDGTFGAMVESYVPGVTHDFAVGDLDGDGELDVVTSNNNMSVDILAGAGDGTFVRVNSLVAPFPRGIDLGDLDGDGDLDIAVALDTGLIFAADSVGVLVNHTYAPGSPFTDLGHALPGSAGWPIHLATGDLQPGSPASFDLQGAVPAGLGYFIIGLSELAAPFEGGILVPAPDKILLRVVDGAGHAAVAGPWPPGASGATLYVQWWFQDPGAIFGTAGSNAIRLDVP